MTCRSARRRALAAIAASPFLAGASPRAWSALPAPAPKWHPGHYVFVGQARIRADHLASPFRGVQRMYAWSDLEPAQERYDFAGIETDLTLARAAGRQLVLQLQYKAFGDGQRRVPHYLQGPAYGGGVFRTMTGALDPVIWNDQVGARLDALIAALGRRFDRDPTLEAVVLPETSVSARLGMEPQPGVEAYSVPAYVLALQARMLTLRQAFPRTVVIQYLNYPVDALVPLANFMRQHGVGMGGPDVYPRDSPLADPQRGVYRLYAPLSGLVPLGAAVQSPDYSVAAKKASAGYKRRGRRDAEAASADDLLPIPVREHLQLARETLKLNYLFWSAYPRANLELVRQMLSAPDLAVDPAGGLVAALPQKAFLAS